MDVLAGALAALLPLLWQAPPVQQPAAVDSPPGAFLWQTDPANTCPAVEFWPCWNPPAGTLCELGALDVAGEPEQIALCTDDQTGDVWPVCLPADQNPPADQVWWKSEIAMTGFDYVITCKRHPVY